MKPRQTRAERLRMEPHPGTKHPWALGRPAREVWPEIGDPREIRARYPRPRTRLIALTGWGQDADRRRAEEAGFDHHLVKPADITALQALLSRAT